MKILPRDFMSAFAACLLICQCSNAFSAGFTTNPNFPKYAIIHNSTILKDQSLLLGVNQAGNLNTPKGSGTVGNNANTLNAGGSVGIAYKWGGGGSYSAGWYDSTSPGKMWEGWGVSGKDSISKNITSGYASVDAGGVSANIVVKSFVVDDTSIKSTVWIMDSAGTSPLFEVTHVYGPTIGATNKNLFQALVTVTNISGGTLDDVRYRRIMDWDILDNTTTVYTDQVGVANSFASTFTPKIYDSCDNGGSHGSITPDPSVDCKPAPYPVTTSNHVDISGWGGSYKDSDGKTKTTNLGASFTFQFGQLLCNESAIFYIYYGAGGSKQEVINALNTVDAKIYSLGYDTNYTNLAYGFGFKGVSGSAVAPTLPTKVTSLPAGSSTMQDVWQTYAPPVLSNGSIYQALFKYQKDKQWIGEVKKYKLLDDGSISQTSPVLASEKLKAKALSGTRSIWTIGLDPACMNTALSPSLNNFVSNTANKAALQSLLFNCQAPLSSGDPTDDLISFVRGFNTDGEEFGATTAPRNSILGDTYHSEMVIVGPPNAPWNSEDKFSKSEAYYRAKNRYNEDLVGKKAGQRESLIYVGANDGMLHAFDLDLNERWAFIPPSVMPVLRNMIGSKGTATTGGDGKSNTIFAVDGPIAVKDVYIKDVNPNSTSKVWKTILIGGLGWGGNGYYALDVTDPNAPKHLFSFSNDASNKLINYWDATGTKSTFPYGASCNNFDYSKLGGAWSRPVIMLLPDQRWVAVFGGGYAGGESVAAAGAASSYGSNIYVIDLEPNLAIDTSTCNATGKSVISSTGGHVINITPLADNGSTIPNGVTANLSVVTGDGTSLATYSGGIAYFTDLQGKLWKFNLSSDGVLFSKHLEFDNGGTLDNDRMGFNQVGTTIVAPDMLFNYFGTGDLTRIQRRTPLIKNRIYGITDQVFYRGGRFMSDSSDSQVTNPVDHSSSSCQTDKSKSWYAEVSPKGNFSQSADFQKIIGRAAVFNKYVYFSAYEPEDNLCPKYGQSRLIEINDSCQSGGAGGVVGQGLATAPVIDNKGNIYVGMSNLNSPLVSGVDNIAKLTASTKTSTGKVQYKSWREKRAY